MKVTASPFPAGLLLPLAFSTAVKPRHGAGRAPKASSSSSSLLNEALKHRMLKTQTQGDLCQNLYPLEVHMVTAFRNQFGVTEDTITVDFDCACNVNGTTLDISCSTEYEIRNVDSTTPGNTIETAKFEAVDGVYQLVQTTYGDSSWETASNPFETYNFEGGVLTSCDLADSCTSCSVCENSNYIAIACGGEPLYYDVDCSQNYTGAYANTFDFGTILVSPELTPDTPKTPEEFCSDLSDLESFLEVGLKDLYTPESTLTNVDFGCTCAAEDEQVTLECRSTDYVLDENPYSVVEKAMLKLTNGVYELVQTSYSDSGLSASLDIPFETYNFEGGQLSSCDLSNCTSCTICDNKIHVAIDCPDVYGMIECGDNFTGALLNRFDFGTIQIEAAADPTAAPAESGAGSPFRSLALVASFFIVNIYIVFLG